LVSLPLNINKTIVNAILNHSTVQASTLSMYKTKHLLSTCVHVNDIFHNEYTELETLFDFCFPLLVLWNMFFV
jgi:hypothetical protein